MSLVIPAGVFLLSQTSWPVSYMLSKQNLMGNQAYVFLAGVICLLLSMLGPAILLRRQIKNVEPLMYVLGVFCWTCMIDLGIGLELDHYISNFIGFYLAEGEPYLRTAHGTVINYWDGTTHFGLYLIILTLYSQRKSYRECALFWVGSILNSMVVLLPGGIAGNHPFKLSILLNTPYILVPLFAGFKLIHEHPVQARSFIKFKPLWQRPLDLFFFLFFIAAICISIFRGLTLLNGNAVLMTDYLKHVEPYMKDLSSFPKFQILAYGYFYLVYYFAAAFGLLFPGKHWMADWSLIHAGAAAQAQVTYIWGSLHHRTPGPLHPPLEGTSAVVFWSINLSLLIIPLLFAVRCLQDVESFGRTFTVYPSKYETLERNASEKSKKLK
ncbi:transmembrane 6 superfamily member 1-like [Physella acuta]|uniref:transmembrane 6 superfamily member 1-like n=1 Tax=Physella acuta TaxID=109671 RepID=UPI0027DB3D34|nr:transmembrane 6 superfamily member 1-like [Physella acuta]